MMSIFLNPPRYKKYLTPREDRSGFNNHPVFSGINQFRPGFESTTLQMRNNGLTSELRSGFDKYFYSVFEFKTFT